MPDDSPSPMRSRRALRRQRRRSLAQLTFIGVLGIAATIGIGVGIGALLVSQNVQGWITGLAVSCESVLLTFLVRAAVRRR